MPSVTFYNADIQFTVNKKNNLKLFVYYIFNKENKVLRPVNIIFCSDDYLLSINQQFLHHDYYTDIITFDLDENNKLISELYISIDRIKENAKAQKISLYDEVNRIIFHGILHLCGYKDKTKSAKQLMTQKEDEYLEAFKSFHVKQKVK